MSRETMDESEYQRFLREFNLNNEKVSIIHLTHRVEALTHQLSIAKSVVEKMFGSAEKASKAWEILFDPAKQRQALSIVQSLPSFEGADPEMLNRFWQKQTALDQQIQQARLAIEELLQLVDLMKHRLELATTTLPPITKERWAPIELARDTIKRLKEALT